MHIAGFQTVESKLQDLGYLLPHMIKSFNVPMLQI